MCRSCPERILVACFVASLLMTTVGVALFVVGGNNIKMQREHNERDWIPVTLTRLEANMYLASWSSICINCTVYDAWAVPTVTTGYLSMTCIYNTGECICVVNLPPDPSAVLVWVGVSVALVGFLVAFVIYETSP